MFVCFLYLTMMLLLLLRLYRFANPLSLPLQPTLSKMALDVTGGAVTPQSIVKTVRTGLKVMLLFLFWKIWKTVREPFGVCVSVHDSKRLIYKRGLHCGTTWQHSPAAPSLAYSGNARRHPSSLIILFFYLNILFLMVTLLVINWYREI